MQCSELSEIWSVLLLILNNPFFHSSIQFFLSSELRDCYSAKYICILNYIFLFADVFSLKTEFGSYINLHNAQRQSLLQCLWFIFQTLCFFCICTCIQDGVWFLCLSALNWKTMVSPLCSCLWYVPIKGGVSRPCLVETIGRRLQPLYRRRQGGEGGRGWAGGSTVLHLQQPISSALSGALCVMMRCYPHEPHPYH